MTRALSPCERDIVTLLRNCDAVAVDRIVRALDCHAASDVRVAIADMIESGIVFVNAYYEIKLRAEGAR